MTLNEKSTLLSNGVMRLLIATMLMVFCLLSLTSCASVKKEIVYFNDSEAIYVGESGTISMPFPYVCMSKGKFREVTDVK